MLLYLPYYILYMSKKKSNAGRKPIAPDDKIVQAYYFVQKKVLDKVGTEQAKLIARNAVEAEFKLKAG